MIRQWTDRVLDRLVAKATAQAGPCQPRCWLISGCIKQQFACNNKVGRTYKCERSDCSTYRMVVCGC